MGSGVKDGEDIKEHKYFKKINWDNVLHKRITPPKCKENLTNNQFFSKPKTFKPDVVPEIDNMTLPGWSFINNDDN